MVAQSLCLKLSPNVSVPLLNDFKGLSYGLVTPFVQPTKWDPIVASPTHYQASCRLRYNARHFLLAMAAHKGEDSNTNSRDLELKPRRKNLAVFVSGGGSNFKSIHLATLNGAILGDVVVLVTNKRVIVVLISGFTYVSCQFVERTWVRTLCTIRFPLFVGGRLWRCSLCKRKWHSGGFVPKIKRRTRRVIRG
uniref:Formyl transferase N-terminal domain-containing protein n=1 Tax=Opuntia streptacantha TaxID=393608 RepID=A0A7C8Z2M7_OPUST